MSEHSEFEVRINGESLGVQLNPKDVSWRLRYWRRVLPDADVSLFSRSVTTTRTDWRAAESEVV